MGANFKSYYWTADDLPEENLRVAFQILASPESTPEQKMHAFGVLLGSDSTAAQCIAFNYFFYQSSLSRFGGGNVFQNYSELLLLRVREQLRREPVDGLTPDGKLVHGANHASALGVIAHLGDERDVVLLTPVLASSSSVSVLFMGCMAAWHCLRDATRHYPELVAALARIARTEDNPEQVRITVVSALSTYDHEEAERTLAELCIELPFPINAYAAAALAARNVGEYRGLLQGLADSWPKDASYPASEVRELLEEDS